MKKKKKLSAEDRGVKLLHNPVLNKGTAFSEEERDLLGLRGLLPTRVMNQDLQAERVLENLRRKPDDLEKYIYLISLQDRNENLFYRVVMDHIEQIMPLIYTPTVGRACQSFGHLFRRSRGFYVNIKHKGRIRETIRNWPHKDVSIIVVTDGERILGLGDLGMDGMGIPIGKLSLYTACAGIHPTQCLPVMLDVGTNNEKLHQDPLYMGWPHHRLTGQEYEELVDEFISAVSETFPDCVIQLEDFATDNAFNLLHKYKDRNRLFDDDIQGTASVALAGLYSALKLTGMGLPDQKLLFLGAGEAGIGIADLTVAALEKQGIHTDEARQRMWFFDSRGLVCRDRTDLATHKRPYAHDHPGTDDLLEAIRLLKPTALIGVSGQGGKFTREVIELMSSINKKPIIFALSNPTANSECTAEQAYTWSRGHAIFASGSPFSPVMYEGREMIPGQGNNVYVFPGVGLGVIYCKSRIVSDSMFLVASSVLSDCVQPEELEKGKLFPSLDRIRDVSARIAEAVCRTAVKEGHSDLKIGDSLLDDIKAYMYTPEYEEYEI